ncbi:MAG: FAD-dependent thymidylate synthase, partial [archaeon]
PPDTLSAAGALSCFEEKASFELLEELTEEKIKLVIKESFGRGHGSVGDQNFFSFSLKNVPRAFTFQVCQPSYLAHLQQSLRRTKAQKIYTPDCFGKYEKKYSDLMQEVFLFYDKMIQNKIPAEDSRYILPLYVQTNIQTCGNSREFLHLYTMTENSKAPSIVKKIVREIITLAKQRSPNLFEDYGKNTEVLSWYPSAQLFAEKSKLFESIIEKYSKEKTCYLEFKADNLDICDIVSRRNESELSLLKHVHFGTFCTFLTPMSLACFHQAIRQRTWDQAVEPIYNAIEREKFVTPPSIQGSDFYEEYLEMNKKLFEFYNTLISDGIPESEAIGVVPHSLVVFDFIHINGWNAIHSIGKRTCTKAQWEIRNIAKDISKILSEKSKIFSEICKPQCEIYGYCPERNPCRKF